MTKLSIFLIINVLLLSLLIGLSSAVKESPDPVRDTNGDILRAGTKYYILSTHPGRQGGGGVTYNASTCPLDVLVDEHDHNLGIPVTFSPVKTKKGVIRVHSDLNVMFAWGTRSCHHQATVWKVEAGSYKRPSVVTTGGSMGRNLFQIEEYGDQVGHYYKLVYCSPSSSAVCKNVGVFMDNGKKHLALTNQPFKVVFHKARA